jgi:hypothetical protein
MGLWGNGCGVHFAHLGALRGPGRVESAYTESPDRFESLATGIERGVFV